MSLFDAVDNYCERVDASLFAEPLNAFSNISFFIAAWLLWRRYRAYQLHDTKSLVLIGLVGLVGFGSSLFHTFANRLTMLTDIIPIGIFVFYYLWLCLHHLIRLPRNKTLFWLGAFAVLAACTSFIPTPYRFNGSVAYFPCLLALLAIAYVLLLEDVASAILLSKAALCFAISLTFRSIDMIACTGLANGTHFFWHLINGVVLYLLSLAIINNCAARQTV